ncbi:hypothetical protein TYRP_013463, partial [Tyrophagus putrescentiae]
MKHLILLQSWCLDHRATALKITLLDIPSPLSIGDSGELICNYDLEDNTLYSFKWYKDGIEFYRYVPRDYPQTQYLKMAGIHVDVRKSSKKSVYLTNVNLATRGKYRCEISAEAPSFVTAAKEEQLDINVLPLHGPWITADKLSHNVSDNVTVNCTSDKSNLEIHLNFTINGEPISNSFEYELKYWTQLHADSLKSNGLSLRFLATDRHWRDGKIKLKCIASLQTYKIQNEANLIIHDANYRPETGHFLSSESQARSDANDNHDKSNLNEWKVFSVLFSMYLHRQLQR